MRPSKAHLEYVPAQPIVDQARRAVAEAVHLLSDPKIVAVAVDFSMGRNFANFGRCNLLRQKGPGVYVWTCHHKNAHVDLPKPCTHEDKRVVSILHGIYNAGYEGDTEYTFAKTHADTILQALCKLDKAIQRSKQPHRSTSS